MTKFEKRAVEDENAKKRILEINEEHPHYLDEAMNIFARETSWGKKVDAAVEEAYNYLEKNDDLLEKARDNGAEIEINMYEYLHKLIHDDFCKKHTQMQEAFCIWSHDALGWDAFGWYGLESPFSETKQN